MSGDAASINFEDIKNGAMISQDQLNSVSIEANPRFETRLEPDNVLRMFIDYGEKTSDAYIDYWFAGGLFVLASTIDKKMCVHLKQGMIFSNLYLNMLGLSTIARKSTAIDEAEKALRDVGYDMDRKVPEEFSPEAFIEHMDSYNHCDWIRDESSGVLSVMKKDYMRGFKDSLMMLFDCKPIRRKLRTKNNGAKSDFNVEDPYLNIIWATTNSSFAANTQMIDAHSGFLARFLHFAPNHIKDKWLPLEAATTEQQEDCKDCLERFERIKEAFDSLQEPLEMTLSVDAWSYYKAWQKAREKEIAITRDESKAQLYGRLSVYVLKMGMLFTVGRVDFAPGIEISLAHIEEACRLVDEYFMPMGSFVYGSIGLNVEKNLIQKVLFILKANDGKIRMRELARKMSIRKKELEEIIAALDSSDQARVVTLLGKNNKPSDWVVVVPDSEK